MLIERKNAPLKKAKWHLGMYFTDSSHNPQHGHNAEQSVVSLSSVIHVSHCQSKRNRS